MSTDAGRSAAETEPMPGEPPRPGKRWTLALAGLIVVFVSLACYDLIAMDGRLGSTGAPAAARTAPAAGAATHHGSASPSASSSPRTARGKSSRKGTGTSAAHSLGVTSVAAFGPDGLSDGDNPDLTSQILNVSSDQPWYSQWYATPDFGNLRSGTGLLLDMGKTVSVSSVQLVLGTAPGADVQIRVGDDPYLADLSPVARGWDVGGTVQLAVPAPVKGRYVLIWFTRLPPGPQGHYQVDVYDLAVDGTASH